MGHITRYLRQKQHRQFVLFSGILRTALATIATLITSSAQDKHQMPSASSRVDVFHRPVSIAGSTPWQPIHVSRRHMGRIKPHARVDLLSSAAELGDRGSRLPSRPAVVLL